MATARTWRSQAFFGASVVGFGVLVIAAFVVAARVLDRSFRYFSKEPAETLEAAPYVGWFAHGTSMVWAVGGVCALLAGLVLWRVVERRELARFLLAGGLLTAVMVADDFFLLHDGVYAKVGIPEELVYGLYGLGAVALAWRWRQEILQRDALLFALAVLAWGASVGSDFVQETTGRHLHVWEDGAKFLGVLLWSTFFVRTAVLSLTAELDRA
ncbi:MAG TPA: hypothetical protein VHF47_00585 [Acidimicrobiales bacterium]|nr:hypothetical protein [Acidimicrobiales bacterium]